ncbi:MAG: DUF167 domain-containing protein [Propionibacteriales bacterium]|nr:DUF167 domain-containing protein [Propionibacteriales bacterium]
MAVRIPVRVKPGSARPRVGGAHGSALVVAVSARPVDGRATAAASRALADVFGVRRSAVALVSGATSRDKVFEVDADDVQVRERLRELLTG